MFNIVLYQPEIPQNTGNIGRLSVATGNRLHLVKPLGFSLDEKYLRRAGMDYWRHVDLTIHEDWAAFESVSAGAPKYFFSTKGEKTLWDCPYEPGSFLIFGRESGGLPPELHRKYADSIYTIPMPGEHRRSLNLANSVAVAVYEGMRRGGTGL